MRSSSGMVTTTFELKDADKTNAEFKPPEFGKEPADIIYSVMERKVEGGKLDFSGVKRNKFTFDKFFQTEGNGQQLEKTAFKYTYVKAKCKQHSSTENRQSNRHKMVLKRNRHCSFDPIRDDLVVKK